MLPHDAGCGIVGVRWNDLNGTSPHVQRTQQETLYHYIIVRADLPTGVRIAQTVHAAGESVKFPILSGTYAIALEVPDEDSLIKLAARLQAEGIQHHLVVETDEPYSGQLMAVGLEPVRDRSKIRRLTSSLRLAR